MFHNIGPKFQVDRSFTARRCTLDRSMKTGRQRNGGKEVLQWSKREQTQKSSFWIDGRQAGRGEAKGSEVSNRIKNSEPESSQAHTHTHR